MCSYIFLLGNIRFRKSILSGSHCLLSCKIPFLLCLTKQEVKGFFFPPIFLFFFIPSCVTSKWSKAEKSMSRLGIDLVYSQATEKPGTVNWKLHLVSDFLNCLPNTCPQLAHSSSLPELSRDRRRPQPKGKVFSWDREWGKGGGHRTSLNGRKGAVTLEARSHLSQRTAGTEVPGPSFLPKMFPVFSHWAARGICHLEYKILA